MISYTYPSPVVAERINKVMKDNKITDKEAAEQIGVERKSILAYRNCISNPPVKFIRWICKTFEVSADWLLDLE